MKAISLEQLVEEVKSRINANVMITFHSIGDTDSVSSAAAILSIFPNAHISTPDIITSNALRVLERCGYKKEAISTKFDENSDLIIIVDANSTSELGNFQQPMEKFKKDIIVIDHHVNPDMSNAGALVFNDESFNSSASIIYELLKRLRFDISVPVAKMLCMGIISDSAELKNATPQTFIQIGELLSIAKTDYMGILAEFSHESSIEARLQTIHSIMHADAFIKHDLIFIYGITDVHAGIAADDAIKIGADIALFKSESSNEVSFSSRLRPTLDTKYGLHFGRIMRKLAPIIEGSGGGHPCAGGAYGPKKDKYENFFDGFTEEILNTLKSNKK
ncbi:DHH family phosphoesterase [Candidatus Marsarchaeota archaeon]|jgi:nanoRNase/pAp phosphatase (c-di-AMP/oligoRNAs hydrolase)|nr:DHH family phosphoesterase [Candidatus Marsarchaeota archaeon]MCL5092319.1 DHH family phosphoesterase [Candidatus Marsarchaeota archaeon]